MRALVIGIDSTIGKSVARHWSSTGFEVIGTSRRRANSAHLYLDLSDDLSAWPLPERIDIAAVFAGVTALRDCESDPEGSWRVNVTGTATLIERLMAQGAFVLFPSSNLVFDGSRPDFSEASTPAPRNHYGRQQVAVERRMAAAAGDGVVLRMTKVISPGFELFAHWRRDLLQRKPVHPFSDMWLAPISLEYTVRAITALCLARLRGLYHTSGLQNLSYAEAAAMIAESAGADARLVQPVPGKTRGVDTDAAPRFGTLDAARLRAAIGFEPPSACDCVLQAVGEPEAPRARGVAAQPPGA